VGSNPATPTIFCVKKPVESGFLMQKIPSRKQSEAMFEAREL